MFEKIAHGISEVFSDVMPHTFCVGCFLQGLVEGAVLAVATVAVIAALPEALAIAAVVGLAVYGVYGMTQLAKDWNGMNDRAKSKALGNITGSLAGGLAGAKMIAPVEPPPGVRLLKGPEGEALPVLTKVGLVDEGVTADPSQLVNAGRLEHPAVQEWAGNAKLENQWAPNPAKFPSGGFKYETSDGTFDYSIHGHGANPVAPPGLNAASGPTARISRKLVGGGPRENFLSDGTWGTYRGNENAAHLPLDNSPH